jgi:hypothetical protein
MTVCSRLGIAVLPGGSCLVDRCLQGGMSGEAGASLRRMLLCCEDELENRV